MTRLNRYNQTIFDYLIEHFDGFRNLNKLPKSSSKKHVDAKAAITLYKIWKEQGNKLSEVVYRKPSEIASTEIQLMQKEGLIKDIGDKVELTDKGKDVIKIMILGDQRSIFSKDNREITYAEAMANVKERSLKISRNKHEKNWWDLATK